MKTAVCGAALITVLSALAASPRLAAAENASPGAAPVIAPAVDSLVAWALAAAPSLAAARARAQAVHTRAAAARGLEDPELEIVYQDVGFPDNTLGKEEMSTLGAELRQPLPFFGKRGARHAAADAEAVRAAADVQTLERQVALEVRQQYARLYALDRRRESLQDAADLLAAVATAANARYAAGFTSMEVPLRAELERARLQEETEDVVAERTSAEAVLAGLLDRPADTHWGEVRALPTVGAPPADWQALAAVNAPATGAGRAAVAVAERRVTLEEREGRPDFFAGVGYAVRGQYDPLVTLRIGSALPVWRGGRTGPRVDAARAEAVMARAELRQAEADARTAAALAVAEWQRRDAQVALLADTIVPQSHTTLAAARSAFETGQADFAVLLEDFRAWLTARQQLAEREAERFAAWAACQSLLVPAAPAQPEELR